MPTGYTAALCDGDVKFEDFVLTCARAMGALFAMREEPPDAAIPDEIKPSSYYENALKSDVEKLSRLLCMPEEEKLEFGESQRSAAIARYKDGIKRIASMRERLIRMRSQVLDWNPPTEDHEGLKAFMLQQLDDTIKYDCETSHNQHAIQSLRNKKPIELYNEEIEAVKRSMAYHEEDYAEEVARAKKLTKWIRDLKASLELVTK